MHIHGMYRVTTVYVPLTCTCATYMYMYMHMHYSDTYNNMMYAHVHLTCVYF